MAAAACCLQEPGSWCGQQAVLAVYALPYQRQGGGLSTQISSGEAGYPVQALGGYPGS
jgi:hypothetical protein